MHITFKKIIYIYISEIICVAMFVFAMLVFYEIAYLSDEHMNITSEIMKCHNVCLNKHLNGSNELTIYFKKYA